MLVHEIEIEPKEELVVGPLQFVNQFLRDERVCHFTKFLRAVIVFGFELLLAEVGGAHIANTFLNISKVDHHVIAVVVQQESKLSLMLHVTPEVAIESLAEVVKAAFDRDLKIMADDLCVAHRIPLLQVFHDLSTQIFDLLDLNF